MRYIAAYLLLQTGGNSSPSADDITKLLGTVGVECDSERLDKLLSELAGKSIDELIAAGSSKLASVPSGGGGGGGSAPAAAASGGGGGGADAAAKEEEKKEEPKVRPHTSIGPRRMCANEICDCRTSPTMIWASDCSTKRRMHVCLIVGTRHTARVLSWLQSCQCSTSITLTQAPSLLVNLDSKVN
jgi:large subunit ribosomal protein LP2